MDNRFEVTAAAGTMMSDSSTSVYFPHRWTPGGVTVEADFTGAHLLHLAAAGCVLNDIYREAEALGIELSGVRVTAAGGFDTTTWQSTGIDYSVEVSSDASADQLARLLEVVDRVAEIPRHPSRRQRPAGQLRTCGYEQRRCHRLLSDGRLAAKAYGRPTSGGRGTYVSFRMPERPELADLVSQAASRAGVLWSAHRGL